MPRVRVPLNDGILRITAAVLNYRGYYGIKVSSTSVFGRNAGRLFCLYREAGGELCAIMQVFGLGALRTGAASGIATRHMARKDARALGVLGSGRQARTQVEAIALVRPIKEIRVFSRDRERCENFCRDIEASHNVNVKAADTAEAAVRDCDIVVTATTSTAPVLLLAIGCVRGPTSTPSAPITSIAGSLISKRSKARCDRRDRRSRAGALRVQRTWRKLVTHGVLDWSNVASLGDIVAGRLPGRRSEQDITLFKSLGVAMEDVALAIRAYDRAMKEGLGQALPNLAG